MLLHGSEQAEHLGKAVDSRADGRGAAVRRHGVDNRALLSSVR